ncbi:unnamed protein product [Gongylonema pulchrum]|uniref:ADP-ribosylglycohydrolase n=1 Tax=Gongylonema pulchrum TaxID=637853 RepID=A0A183E396_9BILA|nr:unnamed protein product [Gongylonema pulchrum]
MQCTKRALGCLYGQVIGDSLGARYEFERAHIVQQKIQADRKYVGADDHPFLPILGGGPFSREAGQVALKYLFQL